VLAPWAPRRAVEVKALDDRHLVVQHVCRVWQALLREVGGKHVGGQRVRAELVVAAYDHNVLVARAQRAEPIVEIRKLEVRAVVGEVARVHENVGGGEVLGLQRAVQHVRVAEVQQRDGAGMNLGRRAQGRIASAHEC
jgi:hypothetical protein